MDRNQLFVWTLAFLMSACAATPKNHWELSSPDGKITTTVKLDESGSVSYTLNNQDRIVLEESPLGIVFKEAAFDQGISFVSENKKTNQQDDYTMLTGKQKENSTVWNELQLDFKNKEQKQIRINFRLFDTGLAF